MSIQNDFYFAHFPVLEKLPKGNDPKSLDICMKHIFSAKQNELNSCNCHILKQDDAISLLKNGYRIQEEKYWLNIEWNSKKQG